MIHMIHETDGNKLLQSTKSGLLGFRLVDFFT